MPLAKYLEAFSGAQARAESKVKGFDVSASGEGSFVDKFLKKFSRKPKKVATPSEKWVEEADAKPMQE